MPVRHTLLIALLATAWPAWAQRPPPLERPSFAVATLPESNEAMLIYNEYEDAVRRGDFRLAIRLTERIRAVRGDLVAAPGGRAYYPIWRHAARMLEQLPDEGIEIYRQMYDAEVRQRFEAARASADLVTLRELFRDYPLSSSWPEIGRELAVYLLDRGEYGETVDVLRALESGGGAFEPLISFQTAVALGALNAHDAAERRLAELRGDPRLPPHPRWQSRLSAAESWLAARRTGRALEAPLDLSAALRLGPLWSQPLTPAERVLAAGLDSDDQIADAADSRRRLPLLQPVVAGETILVRARGTLWAFDALTLAPRWSEHSSDPFRRDQEFGDELESAQRRLSPDAELLLNHTLRHRLSAGHGRVFTIEGLSLPESRSQRFAIRFRRHPDLVRSPNELVARDLDTGRVLWRIGRIASHPLYEVEFQDVPLVLADRIVVPVRERDDLRLVSLDPASGAVRAAISVIGPPTYFGVEGGRCQLLADATTLYLITGNGVVAAFHRDELRWKWAATYPTSLAERRNALGFLPGEAPREFTAEPALLADDLLIAAPLDCPNIFALDRFTGQQRWQIDRAAYSFVAGLCPAGLLLGGEGLTCVALSDGQSVRWRSAPLEVSGRPVIREERVYLPTRQGIATLDARNGKVIGEAYAAAAVYLAGLATPLDTDEREPRGDLAGEVFVGNLAARGEALFGASPNRLFKYADGTALAQRCAARLALNQHDERVLLASGWAAVMGGDYPAALGLIEPLRPSEPALMTDRDRLLSTVFVALSRQSADQEERLAWLRRAEALSSTPDMSARLTRLIGDVLEDARQWSAAARHYVRGVLTRNDALVPEGVSGRQMATGVFAAERLTRVLARLTDAERAQVLREPHERDPAEPADDARGAARAEGDDLRGLMRLHDLLPSGRERAALARSITLRSAPALADGTAPPARAAPLAPELAVRYLPEDDAELPAGLRRTLWLARWETHVALGRLDQADRDRDYWQANFASDDPGPIERIARIELATRKLTSDSEAPLGLKLTRKWRVNESLGLVLDPRAPSPAGAFVLTRSDENHTLELRGLNSGRRQRSTPDRVGGALVAELTTPPEDLERPTVGPLGAQNTWPALIHEQLAVISSRGGLICVGLGPERSGGQRLWDQALPEVGAAAGDFSRRVVVGPHGVHVLAERNRLLLLDWLDGRTAWQRTLREMSIEQIELVGDLLALLTDDGQLYVLDARYGGALRRVGVGAGTLRGLRACQDVLLVLTEDGLYGLSGPGLDARWRLAQRAIGSAFVAAEPGWVAVRPREETRWKFFDIRNGAELWGGQAINAPGELVAIRREGERVYLAAMELPTGEDSGGPPFSVPRMRLIALRADSGERLWEWAAASGAPPNSSQLSASPDWIPVLLLDAETERAEQSPVRSLKIQMISKRDGSPGAPPEPIGQHFDDRGIGRTPHVYLLASPTRLVVQGAGILAGFGTTAEPGEPVESVP